MGLFQINITLPATLPAGSGSPLTLPLVITGPGGPPSRPVNLYVPGPTGPRATQFLLSPQSTTSNPGVVIAGAAFGMTVTAQNQSSNTAVGYAGTVHFTSSVTGDTLPADYTFVAGDQGVHTFTNTFTLVGKGSLTQSPPPIRLAAPFKARSRSNPYLGQRNDSFDTAIVTPACLATPPTVMVAGTALPAEPERRRYCR